MILSKRVALGGVQLDEIHERIVVRRIDAGVPHENLQAVNRMGGAGQRLTGQHWESKDVTVGFAIDLPKEAFELRRQIWDRVISWALGKGWLTCNEAPGKRMYVDKVVLPGIGDLWEWTNEYTLTFRAYAVPFWQDETAAQVVSNNITSGRLWMDVPGHFRTVADVQLKNISGMTIPNLSVNAGGNAITLNGVNLTASETLTFSHGTDGYLRITAGSRNVYGYRTAGSADDLYLDPGSRAIDVSATRAVKATVAAFGRYA